MKVILFSMLLVISGLVVAADPFESTYQPRDHETTLIKGASVFDGAGRLWVDSDLLIQGGKVREIGKKLDQKAGLILDASDKWITPGIIDVHSHLGVYPSPAISSTSDGNESTSPNTANVWAEHSVWPQDPQFSLALAGGVTTMQILPGSANLFGGRGVTIKNVPSRTVQGMKFPSAPHGLKMACGENPKRVYGSRKSAPSTRMGNVAGYRAEWLKAVEYRDRWRNYDPEGEKPAPSRDLRMETLVGVLDGEIIVHNHCYRADEMATLIEVSKEFGYKIGTFHHAVESYKIADLLAQEEICSAMWADWWGFKLEAFDGILQNIALVENAGACAIVHSDSARDIQRLNQEASKARSAGIRMGIDISKEDAIGWITLNAAKSLGIEKVTGSLEPGKAADLVIWSRDPFSVYSKAEKVFIDGYLYFDRITGKKPVTDFALEQLVEVGP